MQRHRKITAEKIERNNTYGMFTIITSLPITPVIAFNEEQFAANGCAFYTSSKIDPPNGSLQNNQVF
jgi:hypothetical protein